MSTDNGDFKKKLEHSKEVLRGAIDEYDNVAVACSFGKDSMAAIHVAREVDPDIAIFSILTPYKPKETFEYLVDMDKKMNINPIVYYVGDEIPPILRDNNINVVLLPNDEFEA
ncbi:MAG: phosphoadenosine phosphosulfate reductase family protein, partial [Halobacteriota archaeon]|nr:phosphoadenosine phosphosulfate reductase family protein [Halobacteriota archaeon]